MNIIYKVIENFSALTAKEIEVKKLKNKVKKIEGELEKCKLIIEYLESSLAFQKFSKNNIAENWDSNEFQKGDLVEFIDQGAIFYGEFVKGQIYVVEYVMANNTVILSKNDRIGGLRIETEYLRKLK